MICDDSFMQASEGSDSTRRTFMSHLLQGKNSLARKGDLQLDQESLQHPPYSRIAIYASMIKHVKGAKHLGKVKLMSQLEKR